MLISTQTHRMIETFGIEGGITKLIDAGYTGLDYSFFGDISFCKGSDGLALAKKLKKMAAERGVVFNQAHAPFGGGYDNYTQNLIPTFPDVFEFCSELGVKDIVVHPLQKGRYYGRADELFEMNMEFYASLAPLARRTGVKIAIENMWQRHPIAGYITDDVCADPYELAKYYDTVNDPENFTVCLDIGHVALCGREPEDAIKIIGHDRLGALHVHDVDYKDDLHTLPGCGKIKYYEVAKALAEIDYKGDFTLEADNFLVRYSDEYKPFAAKFMADTAKHFASCVDAARPKK